MSEISRSEKARQERLAAEKPKPDESTKDNKSQFDKVLEESRLTQKSQPFTQQVSREFSEQATKEVRHYDEQNKDDDRKDQKKDKDQKGDQNSDGKKESSGILSQRVMAKGQSKQGQGSDSGGRGGHTFSQSKKGTKIDQQKSSHSVIDAALQGKFAQKLQANMAKSMQNPVLTQSVLNQIVQYVRLGLNETGEKEILIELKEKFFKGLKLKVSTAKDGKVNVHFITDDNETRSTFEANANMIKETLTNKGILVEEIKIT